MEKKLCELIAKKIFRHNIFATANQYYIQQLILILFLFLAWTMVCCDGPMQMCAAVLKAKNLALHM